MSQEEFGAKMGGWSVASVSAADGQESFQYAVRVAVVCDARREMLSPSPVAPVFHVDIHVVWLECAAGEGAEYIHLCHQAQWPLSLRFIELAQDVLNEHDRPFALHLLTPPQSAGFGIAAHDADLPQTLQV